MVYLCCRTDMCIFSVFVVVLFAISTHSGFPPISPLCRKDRTGRIPSDCSSLMIGENASLDGCFMFNNSECQNFPFEKWTNASLSTITNEADSGFDIAVFAYGASDGTAYNITITNLSPVIEGFYMYFEHDKMKFRSCRIFDFRNLNGSFKYPFSIYYDCFFALDQVSYKYFLTELTVRSLPENKQVIYAINVPKTPLEATGCDYETLIMYHVEALHENKISIKFQKFPRRLNITKYEVKLTNVDTLAVIERKQLDINNSDGKKMMSTVFKDVDKGRYKISVKPLRQDGRRCFVSYVEIGIQKKLPDYSYVGWTIGAIVFVVLLAVVSFFAIKRKQKSILKKSKQKNMKILLVYHPDSREFLNLMICFAEYLETLIPCEILAYWKLVNEDSASWIRTSVDSANVIIIVLSSGAITGNIDMPVPPPYGSLFSPICRHVHQDVIMNPESSSKTYLKVYFENCDFHDIPQELKLAELGPQYQLMKDFNKVFCYIIERSALWSCFFQFPESQMLNAAIEELKRPTAYGT